jgi:hypothetical protein
VIRKSSPQWGRATGKQKHTRKSSVFCSGEGGIRKSSPQWGHATGKQKHTLADVFCSGEGGIRTRDRF